MEFATWPQLLGYFGTVLNLGAACIIAWWQRASGLYWPLIVSGNAAWLVAGYQMGSAAVMADVLAFLPVHTVGWLRHLKRPSGTHGREEPSCSSE